MKTFDEWWKNYYAPDGLLAGFDRVAALAAWNYVLNEKEKKRTSAQNSKNWADVMKQISEQAEVEGKKFLPEIWHEYFKRKFLPSGYEDGVTLKCYKKWDKLPHGDHYILLGSTKQLTTKGFAQYMQDVEVYAATELGVRFLYKGTYYGK